MAEAKITRLPPGEALGARDLEHWASRRLAGRAGMPMSKMKRELAAQKRERDDPVAFWLKRKERRLAAEQNGGNTETKRSRRAPGRHDLGPTRR
jgi:hypothetical protein